MAGVTDSAFRALAVKYGAVMTWTEFVSSRAVIMGNESTEEYLKRDSSEKVCAVQIFGSNPDEILEAAKILENRFDVIDINCGCPATKIIKIKAGVHLMETPEKIGDIVKKLKSEIRKPVTVKIRIGTKKRINGLEVARIAEKNGADAVIVHGRRNGQGYAGTADWKVITKIKEELSIPVVGNGDLISPEIFKKRLEESKVDYGMVGRAAMSNPYIFRQINDFLKKGEYDEKPWLEQLNDYINLAVKHDVGFHRIKNHSIWFTKGVPGGARLRERIQLCKDVESIISVIAKPF